MSWRTPGGAGSLADRLTGQWRLGNVADPATAAVAALPSVHRMAARHAARGLAEVLRPAEALVLVQAQPQVRPDPPRLSVDLVALTDERAVAAVARVHHGEQPWRTTREFDEAPLASVRVERVAGPPSGLHLRWAPGRGFTAAGADDEALDRVRSFLAAPTDVPFPEVAALLALPPLDPAAPPPDWYPDPDPGAPAGLHRFWDGARWTGYTWPGSGPALVAPTATG